MLQSRLALSRDPRAKENVHQERGENDEACRASAFAPVQSNFTVLTGDK